MLLHIALVIATVCSSQGFPRPAAPQAPRDVEPRQYLYVPERQQYAPDLQYDLSLLEPQFQNPYNFIGGKQFPRVQPQIFYYHGGTPGQPFLLNPGPPPGNFLVPQPQPGPNVILRDSPQRPVFVAGYPKPAHIPPIEKDAEEIPTNPARIPPLAPKGNPGRRPEKLETLNEQDNNNNNNNNKPSATEADVLAAADRNSYFNTKTNLQPGQRFFVLNGQPLFSYPYNNQIYPGVNPNNNLKYTQEPQLFQSQFQSVEPIKNAAPLQNLIRNGITGQIDDVAAQRDLSQTQLPNLYPENLIFLNQQGDFQDDASFKTSLPLEIAQTRESEIENKSDLKTNNERNKFENAHLEDGQVDNDNDAIVIEAIEQDEAYNKENSAETESEEDVSVPERSNEPTIAQAQPGAIALAGPGGVAAAAPRGTAFVGKDGVAVASPQATAVAGPKREDEESEPDKKPQSKRKQ